MTSHYTNTVSAVCRLLFCLFIITSASSSSFIRQVTDDFNANLHQENEPGPDPVHGEVHYLHEQEISSRDYKVSASDTVKGLRDRPPSTYSLKMESFNTLLKSTNADRYVSRPFAVGGYNWTLVVYPNGNKNDNGAKVDGQMDPRWPLLNRWSVPRKITSPAQQSNIDSQAESVSRQMQARDLLLSSHTNPLETKEMALQKASAALETVCETTANDSQTNPVSTTMDPNPVPGEMNLQKNLITEEPPAELTFATPFGAWKKPLSILSPTLQQGIEGTHCAKPVNSQWPPLNAEKVGSQRTALGHDPLKASKIFEDSEAYQASLTAQSKEYPWAARMNQSLRNLHRVTIPEYMEDGTPKVRIPSHVLLGGLENQKEFVVGQFYRCLAPTGGQIQAVATRIWGRKCRIFTRKLGESTYLFHIPDEATRKWVLQRGLWHIDDCLMFVSPWSPTDTISIPEITTVPVWLTLLNIPDQLYSILGIKWIASGIGEPLLTEKPWLDPTQMGKAKILVEVKLDKPFPKRVALIDKTDVITMVDVSYSWLPSTCGGCGQLGHKASRCLNLSSKARPEVLGFANNNGGNEDSNASGKSMNASPQRDEADPSKSCPASDCVGKISEDTHEKLIKAHVLVPTLASGHNTTPITLETLSSNAKASTNNFSPTILFNSVTTETSRKSKDTAKAAMHEASTSKQLIPPSVKVDSSIRRCLSGSLSTNRYASLDSSDDDGDSDKDDDAPALTDEVEPIEFLTPSGKRILRERPVKPSEKVKEMQWQNETGGRGNRGRGRRGGRG